MPMLHDDGVVLFDQTIKTVSSARAKPVLECQTTGSSQNLAVEASRST